MRDEAISFWEEADMPRPRKPDALTPAEKSRRARANLGGTVKLTKSASAALDLLIQPGETKQAAIERILRQAAAKP